MNNLTYFLTTKVTNIDKHLESSRSMSIGHTFDKISTFFLTPIRFFFDGTTVTLKDSVGSITRRPSFDKNEFTVSKRFLLSLAFTLVIVPGFILGIIFKALAQRIFPHNVRNQNGIIIGLLTPKNLTIEIEKNAVANVAEAQKMLQEKLESMEETGQALDILTVCDKTALPIPLGQDATDQRIWNWFVGIGPRHLVLENLKVDHTQYNKGFHQSMESRGWDVSSLSATTPRPERATITALSQSGLFSNRCCGLNIEHKIHLTENNANRPT